MSAAAGAFGWVQHARNMQTGEEVAVKFIELGPVSMQCQKLIGTECLARCAAGRPAPALPACPA